MRAREYISFSLYLSFVFANDLDFNAAINTSYGNNYDFYNYSENVLDINFFYNDLQGWLQYEYSNPPDIGFPINDIRKFRVEYSVGNYNLKLGDIYEIWGRGLVLNQFDDQITNFDNGSRGMLLEYSDGPFILSHINGNSNMYSNQYSDRIPDFNNVHNMNANRVQYDFNNFALGLTQLRSNEEHQVTLGPNVSLNHNLKGAYFSMIGGNFDIFSEYVDKISTEYVSTEAPNDTLKHGFGVYHNFNFYVGNWGISTEYKRYSFDAAHGDITVNDFGNQIEFQQMPTLGKEQNATLLGRVTHNYNFNDERGVQIELNGSVLGLAVTAQYAHLSRDEEWRSLTNFDWDAKSISNLYPSSNESALPYWENYQEISGYLFDEKLYFKVGRGENKDILKTPRYFDGKQRDSFIDSFWSYDTTDTVLFGYDYQIIDSTEVYDTTFSNPYDVVSKWWQEARSFTIPLELNYIFDNGFTFGVGFQYQERSIMDKEEGNSVRYSAADSAWQMYNPEDYTEYFEESSTKFFTRDGNPVNTQYNRLLYISISKAPKWSFTITQDWTTAFDAGVPIDPYYNPLEALVYGDLKYFTGGRDSTDPPSWTENRWVSAEFAYNITSSQRLSIFYGSIQGGLFCSNGVCRLIPPFNDGLKITYSASF
tara:strand:+ start:3819 stop:5768 length:1950 start_codon:yes stop_codon:yes gene_type:complete